MIEFPPGLALEQMQRGWVVVVDPGLIHPAVALFHHTFLRCARRVKVPGALSKLPIGERCRQVVDRIGAACLELMLTERAAAVVVERPQVYRASRSKGDPNDLIPLAMVIGGVAQGFGAPVIAPTPQDWAGATKKSETGDPWRSGRGELVQQALSGEERKLCESTHDAIDACMMGLVTLRRIGRYYPTG